MVSVAKLEQLLETSLTRAHGRAFFRGLAIAPPYLPSGRPGAPHTDLPSNFHMFSPTPGARGFA